MQPSSKKPKITEVKPDVEWGLYMWRLPSGKLFQDGNGNYLNIPSRKYDIEKIKQVRQAAAHFGQPEGTVHFEPGVQRATEEERREQEDLLRAGEINPKDFGAIADELRGSQADGAGR